MGFGNLESDAGLTALNCFLADKSYIDGWVPSQADVVVYKAVAAPPKEAFVHALRWYRHISSYSESDQQSWPGVAKALDQYGPGGAAASDTKGDIDSDFDLFGSDSEEETAEAERLKEERIAEYAARKSKKPAVVAKSSIILDVKPWDDETDMADVERAVRSVEADGLLWGQSKLVPLAYGIKKLQIGCVVEDDKVGTDFLEEEITKFEDLVQSVDVAAFNKV